MNHDFLDKFTGAPLPPKMQTKPRRRMTLINTRHLSEEKLAKIRKQAVRELKLPQRNPETPNYDA